MRWGRSRQPRAGPTFDSKSSSSNRVPPIAAPCSAMISPCPARYCTTAASKVPPPKSRERINPSSRDSFTIAAAGSGYSSISLKPAALPASFSRSSARFWRISKSGPSVPAKATGYPKTAFLTFCPEDRSASAFSRRITTPMRSGNVKSVAQECVRSKLGWPRSPLSPYIRRESWQPPSGRYCLQSVTRGPSGHVTHRVL